MGRGNFGRQGPIVKMGTFCREMCKNGWSDQFAFGLWTRVDTKKHGIRWGSHWRHVANTTEPSMCCSDAAFCEIILTTCYTTDYTTELGSATANRAVRRIVKKVQMSSNLQVYA